MLQSLQDVVVAKAAAATEAAQPMKEGKVLATTKPSHSPITCATMPPPPQPDSGSPPAVAPSLPSPSSSSTSIFSTTSSHRTAEVDAEVNPLEDHPPSITSPPRNAKGRRLRAKSASSQQRRSIASPRRRRRNSFPPMFTWHPAINEHSRALANFGVGRPYASVFHKLHAQGVAARRRKLEAVEQVLQKRDEQLKALAKPVMSETTRNLVKNRGKKMLSTDCQNYGSMLYMEAQERGRQRAADIVLAKNKEEKELLKGVTWKPAISSLAQRVNPIQPNGEPRYARARQPVPPSKVVEYPFTPALDKRSVDIAKVRRPRSSAIHENLFAEAAQRRWRSEDRRLQNELFEQHHLFTAWQQLTLGGVDMLGASDLESSPRMEELLSGTLPGQSTQSRSAAAAAHFRSIAAPSALLDTNMAVASKKADAAKPRRRVPPPVTYRYDNPTTTLSKLYTLKHSPTV
eukprot:GGOE01014320.1.p1 GENE.GGOE01014320.1~~GGOE01014320.1.p1  ORF type:complete len:539 (-),score=122.77 GGOE01014320.1:329-1705(-)